MSNPSVSVKNTAVHDDAAGRPAPAAQTLFAHQLVSYLPNLRKYIASRVSDRHDAEDLVQDTLVRSLKVTAHGRISNPLAYSLSVARSVLTDYWRNRPPQADGSDLVAEPVTESLDEAHIMAQKVEYLQTVLEQLPPLRREVFVMRRVQGKSRDEIATALGLSTEAVKKHITRAMISIAAAMEEQGY
ncbi:RNA polymerase sigma factor [Thalassolituus sp. LLYu03]|uniref:RNA polymerase sigma factor n=1 Tax=Thalassolituus sp. LLYu03 TaxID=3421656 RepID=UPI003D2AA9BB